jgi:hypothetical protein
MINVFVVIEKTYGDFFLDNLAMLVGDTMMASIWLDALTVKEDRLRLRTAYTSYIWRVYKTFYILL